MKQSSLLWHSMKNETHRVFVCVYINMAVLESGCTRTVVTLSEYAFALNHSLAQLSSTLLLTINWCIEQGT